MRRGVAFDMHLEAQPRAAASAAATSQDNPRPLDRRHEHAQPPVARPRPTGRCGPPSTSITAADCHPRPARRMPLADETGGARPALAARSGAMRRGSGSGARRPWVGGVDVGIAATAARRAALSERQAVADRAVAGHQEQLAAPQRHARTPAPAARRLRLPALHRQHEARGFVRPRSNTVAMRWRSSGSFSFEFSGDVGAGSPPSPAIRRGPHRRAGCSLLLDLSSAAIRAAAPAPRAAAPVSRPRRRSGRGRARSAAVRRQ
jgi:hypothetical protein